MRKTKSTVIALSTVAALLATGGAATAVATTGSDASPASADASQAQSDKERGSKAKPYAKHPPKGDGSKRLCKRAPKIDKRIDKLQRRLDGGLRTRGSIDRLEKRVENAKEADHGVIADFLGDRLDDRRALKVTLKDREGGLKKVRAFCAEQTEGKGGSENRSESSEG